MELVNYINWVALGIIIVCYLQMINFSYQLWKHVSDDKFNTCAKIFTSCVSLSTAAALWLIYSHYIIN